MFQDQSGSKIHKTTQVAPLFTTIVNMNWHTSDLAKPIINFSNELSHVLTSEIVTLTLLLSSAGLLCSELDYSAYHDKTLNMC